MIESYATEAATFLIGISTGIAIRAKFWWKNKTTEEKKSFVYEVLQSLEDGKITTAEAKDLIKNHL
ncbi:hypothetical protein RE476_02735 [Methanolobus mangrovi]|uniref:Uncharacterized protein n=1 Tax=Methanolobus mangrovi TaxID=3072977 RepID=A0AA51UGJ0_9EURY|nr:hypothetical protein [Methanolobus mangrovi]WMW22755.1 hypothetical protein RE476_02735 [Methanolobus mangrovi]